MSATQSLPLPLLSQEAFIQYHKTIIESHTRLWNLRSRMEEIDKAYLRETDNTVEHQRAKAANRAGDSNKIQNVVLPIIAPQVFQAVSYQAAIFLSQYPIFEIAASPTDSEAAEQMQALIEENSIRGGWAREILLFFFDGFKYNISAIEAWWDKKVTAAIETDISFSTTEGKPKNIIWQGNCLGRWDMYNTYFDARCDAYDIPTWGDYAGKHQLLTKNALKILIASLETKLISNIRAAFESPSLLHYGTADTPGYYIPQIHPDALINREDIVDSENWFVWANVPIPKNPNSINYKGLYEVSTEYLRITPSDFGLKVPAQNTPQVWKLIIVNHSVIIYAERQTNAHEKIPVFFGQPACTGLGYQDKALAQDARPFQDVTSALMNSVLASRRRAITDRLLYDPSRVADNHINNPNPSAKIPVRPSAYGKPVQEAVYQFPFRDDQAGLTMQEIQALVQFGNVLNGQNPARQGQFVKGNKTDGQWESTMTNATSKDQMTALMYENQVFTPMKEVLKLNYLQYQGGTTVYTPSTKKPLQIDPVKLRQAVMTFKITDGYLPKDKVISADALKIAMQVIGSSPTLAQAYNIGPMFSYIMENENVDLDPFEKSQPQIAYEQAMQAWTVQAQMAIQKGSPFNVPQPLPAQFGYDPNMADPEKAGEVQAPSQNPAQLPAPQ